MVSSRIIKIKRDSKKENDDKMDSLSDRVLVKAYIKARESNLNSDFIHVFKKEIEKRELCLDNFNVASMK